MSKALRGLCEGIVDAGLFGLQGDGKGSVVIDISAALQALCSIDRGSHRMIELALQYFS